MPAPDTLLDGLRRVSALLAEWPHPAAIVGGLAMIARVAPRHTDDIDLVLALPAGTAPAFLSLAGRHGLQHDAAETQLLLQGGLLRLFLPPSREAGVGVDVLVADSPFLGRVLERATPVDLGVCRLSVASVEDLLLLKLDANRPEDIDDILAIKDAFAATLDLAYVRAEAKRHALTPVLELYFGPPSS